jgi:hypothetical protein
MGLWLATAPLKAEVLPELDAKDLNGQPVALAAALSRTAATILLVGFSHGSSDACKAWEDILWAGHGKDPHCSLYSLYEIEGAPGFVVPMITHGIRSKTPEERQSHVLLTRKGRSEWQARLGYDAKAGKDDPYLVLVDAGGKILWQDHGSAEPGRDKALEAALAKALAAP